jgi:CRISPR-associated protein Csm1
LNENDIQKAAKRLMAFAIQWLAEWSGQTPGSILDDFPGNAGAALQPYRALLQGNWTPPQPGDPLLSIFSRVQPEGKDTPPQRYWRPAALSLEPVEPVEEAEARTVAPATLWEGFAGELARLLQLSIDETLRFEAFTHLLHRWAWAVPCSYGEPGVSFCDEFRALSALVHASGCAEEPADKFLLVGGDVPGIQDFVYTITSKGAAKGLRGRSFFVQLLGDAVVRRLLADLGLPEANVIYAAGGNFMLLAPAGAETKETTCRVRRQVNARLVEAIQGDTALVLETMPVDATDLFAPDRFKGVRNAFARQLAKAKGQPLRELADDWETLFDPKGKGSEMSCVVCRIEIDEHNSKELELTGEVPEGIESPRICYLCNSFADLARDIRHDDLWVTVTKQPDRLGTAKEDKDGWADLLARMTGWQYTFGSMSPKSTDHVLAINQPDFLNASACGFRLLANVTPVVSDEDRQQLRRDEEWDDEDIPQGDQIRSFAILAKAAKWAGAIERVGVLRMDVDGLGRTFGEGVPDLTLPKLSALSAALDRFFGGYLNTLVRDQAPNDLYIIYAGGDDLFIVGAWHHLPDLAEAIRDRFKAFTGDNPALSLSGGLTLEGAKFPLYRAAERAGEAEHRAKSYTRPDGRGKDAFCFLGTVVDWEGWGLVRETEKSLSDLIGDGIPRSLLQIAQTLHTQFAAAKRRVVKAERKAGRKPIPGRIYWDRWVWMAVYSLTRLARGCPERQQQMIMRMQREWIETGERIHYLGLAARWAEYRLRGGEK